MEIRESEWLEPSTEVLHQRSVHYVNFNRAFNKIETPVKENDANYIICKCRPALIISPTEDNVHNCVVIPIKTDRKGAKYNNERYMEICVEDGHPSLLCMSQITVVPVTSIKKKEIGLVRDDKYKLIIDNLSFNFYNNISNNDINANKIDVKEEEIETTSELEDEVSIENDNVVDTQTIMEFVKQHNASPMCKIKFPNRGSFYTDIIDVLNGKVTMKSVASKWQLNQWTLSSALHKKGLMKPHKSNKIKNWTEDEIINSVVSNGITTTYNKYSISYDRLRKLVNNSKLLQEKIDNTISEKEADFYTMPPSSFMKKYDIDNVVYEDLKNAASNNIRF